MSFSNHIGNYAHQYHNQLLENDANSKINACQTIISARVVINNLISIVFYFLITIILISLYLIVVSGNTITPQLIIYFINYFLQATLENILFKRVNE